YYDLYTKLYLASVPFFFFSLAYAFIIFFPSSYFLFFFFFFFFNDTATTEIYTLSLHDALPISRCEICGICAGTADAPDVLRAAGDRKSTRLNSSHDQISYAVFCLKKKKKKKDKTQKRNPIDLYYRIIHPRVI